jgi:hypothetical protein
LCHFLIRSILINPQDSSVVLPGSLCFLVCRTFIILGNVLVGITRLITLPYILIRQRLYVLYCRFQWVVSVECCQVQVSATSWSLFQRSLPTGVHRCVSPTKFKYEAAVARVGL